LTKRSTVTVTPALRSLKAARARSASTMSFSIDVCGECGRRIDSVKYAGSSRSQP